jgi:hypothetical protein
MRQQEPPLMLNTTELIHTRGVYQNLSIHAKNTDMNDTDGLFVIDECLAI